MEKQEIGSVASIFRLPGNSMALVIDLVAQLNVGDLITFEGWGEGVTWRVEELEQAHKKVSVANPGKAGIVIQGMPVAPHSKVYKIIR